MEPVSLVVGALAGVGDAAKTAVADVYRRSKSLVAVRFAGRPDDEMALVKHEADPATWEKPLAKALTETGAAAETEVLALAEQLMGLVDPEGVRAGKYVVNLAGAKGVQAGDDNTQTNTFS